MFVSKYEANTRIYEGRSINKLQNDIIHSNTRFVGNLIGDIYWNFYDDDVITVTSLVLRTHAVSQCSILPSISFTTRKC